MHSLKPKAIKPGDTIGVIAPSFFIEKKVNFNNGIDNSLQLGYNIKFSEILFKKIIYTTGKAEERANDIMQMFIDDEVKAIICSDGGCTAI